MLTGTPITPATAHSTWGLSAGGAEWTCRTPRTVTLDSLRADEVRLPQRPRLRRHRPGCPGSRQAAASTPLRIVPYQHRLAPPLTACRAAWCSGSVDTSVGTTEAFPAFLTERDIAALLFVADMYAVQLDQLAAVLGVTEARARAITLGWRRARYAESARIGPGRPWVWLTRAGLSACGLPYRAASPALSRLAHLRAVTSVRLALEATSGYAAAGAFWRAERRLRARTGGR